jgi:NitT/TauT family transport system substrate-binding protein
MSDDTRYRERRHFLKQGLVIGGALAASPLLPLLLDESKAAANLPEIDLPITRLPSLNETVAMMIRAGEFDQKNGIKINFKPRPLGPALNDYRSGTTSLNAAATIVHEGDHINQGIPTRALFGTLDYYGTVLTADPKIKTLKDLEGKKLGAATVSGNYAIFSWFAKKAGLDLGKAQVLSLGVPALVTTLLADRVDALQCWEPGASIAQHKQPGKFHRIDYAYKWKEYTGFEILPYLTVAAKDEWVKAHEKLVPKMYATYKDASDFLYANKQEGIAMMAKEAKGKIPKEVLTEIVEKDTLEFHPHTFQDIRKETEAVLEAMVDVGRLKKMPGPDLFASWG